MKSVMKHKFSNVPGVEIPRSVFDRSHGYSTTFDAGKLVPILVDWAYPGDTFKMNMTGFARLATPIFPIMDNMYMDTFFFAVPIRLLWTNFKKFMGEQANPGDSIDYTIPICDDGINFSNETLHDYIGLPTLVNATYDFNNLVCRAYNFIWNEWFRDQNLQDSVPFDTDDGPDNASDYVLLSRGKRHDYFTSCLPFLQKGDAVQLSLGTWADVVSDPATNERPDFTVNGSQDRYLRGVTTNTVSWSSNLSSTGDVTWKDPKLMADLSTAIGPLVNEMREAFQVQRLLERDARSGTRYTEIVKSHFGVTSPDARMQRPEYLGGGSTPVMVSAVPRTDSSPGKLGAMGVAKFHNHGFVKSFTEHCIVIGLVNVRADLRYQQGLPRHYSYQTRYDTYFPGLAHLGEQAVLNKELYLDATSVGNGVFEEVFGYQERWAEMRYFPSQITGKFRSNDPASLDSWHLSEELSNPTLDDTFIVSNPPLDRCIAVPSEPHFIFDSYQEYICTRPMPTYSVPGLIDHF